MSERNTVLRSMHDLGLAAWFGGALMGAVALNEAAAAEGGSREGADRIASTGWTRWAPVNLVAIGVHMVGTGGLLAVNAARVPLQQGLAASTVAKTACTAAALATTAWAGVLGAKVRLATSPDPRERDKAAHHPVDLERARRQLRCVQWAVPAFTGALVVLNALHGEQQRPMEQLRGTLRRAAGQLPWT
ncbi:hypothetical protein ACIQI7_21210 [Kitasatospora sp. NPDC092039]|uniref:hypothetical protein n=1 Tax=unclassified Kitasatospora TaxID=2633591 RepID=UPI0036797575|nr:hypothetical protein KitaXyl93_74830 [Kitasatospora sp. Xyl93]